MSDAEAAVAARGLAAGLAFAVVRGFAFALGVAAVGLVAFGLAAVVFAFAAAGAAALAAVPGRSRLALRRCGRAFGRLPKTSRSPSGPEVGSLEAMARFCRTRSSEAPRAPKLETNSSVS